MVTAAICRKVAAATRDYPMVQVWGDGEQTRSFCYVDDAVEGILRVAYSNCGEPLDVGSDERISINYLTQLVADVAGKKIILKHVQGPIGGQARNSDNTLMEDRLGWKPVTTLREGLAVTYRWVSEQLEASQPDRGDGRLSRADYASSVVLQKENYSLAVLHSRLSHL